MTFFSKTRVRVHHSHWDRMW